MLGRYAVRKFFIITSAIALIVGSLQIAPIQKKLLNLCVDSDSKIEFSETTGIFPFDFSMKELSFKNREFRIDIDNLKFKFGKSLLRVNNIDIDKAKVTILQETKLCPSDLKLLLPIVIQKFIKSAQIHELDVAGEIIKNISLVNDRKTNNNTLFADSGFGRLMAFWNFKDTIIQGSIEFNGISLQASYDRADNHLIAKCAGATIDGIWNDVFRGNVVIGGFKPEVVISSKDEFFNVNFQDRSVGLSGKLDYNLDKFVAYIHDVFVSDIAKLTPCSIDSSLKVSDFSVVFKKGKIDIKDIDFSSDNFSLGKCVVSAVDLSQLDGLNLKGIINGSGIYQDSREELKLNGKNLQFGDLKIPSLELASQHTDKEAKISLCLDLFGKKQKLDFSLQTKNWLVDKDSRLDFKTAGSIDITDMKIASGQRIRGKISYKIQSTGTLRNPSLNGNVDMKDGLYVNLATGTYIRDIGFDCDLNKNVLNIKKIYARDDSKKGGIVSGSGKIQYASDRLDTNVSLNIDNLKAVDQKWLDARISGDLSFKGDLLNQVNVRGTLYSEKPSIDISGIVLLSMRSTDLIAKPKKVSSGKSNFAVKFPTDIKFEVRPDLKVTGFGLNSSWSANATVTGDLTSPNYVAVAKLKKGKIDLTDNAFRLKEGDVLIDKNDMNILVSAEKTTNKIIVGAKFTQKNGESKVNFYSNPYMSDKDIMSYILFDKNASEISMGEGMTLLSTMNKLSGGSDFDILGRMKTIFGIDNISIKKNKDSSGEEYNAVSLGKKIGKFKVSVDQATGKDETSVVVEADVAKNTKVSVDLSSRDSFGGGILWSRRY